jgi:multiple sugar transport system permease protein
MGGMKKRRGSLLSGAVVLVFLAWVLVPIVVLAENSLKPAEIVFSDPPKWIFAPTLSHYHDVLTKLDFGRYMVNGAIVAGGSTLLALVIGTPAAYALCRARGRASGAAGLLILFCRMVPATVLIVPMFVIFSKLHLINRYPSLLIAHTTFDLPLVVWLMRSFFADIPRELEEATMTDGARRFTAFWRVVLPLTAPGLTATSILCLLFSWNEFLFALVLSGPETRTMPVGVSSFIGTVSIDWGGSSAAAMLAVIPVFILGLFVQRFLVRGLTLGAVKG